MPTTVTARYGFEAAHRLHDCARSDTENAEAFGPCNRLHGHSYHLEVSVTRAELADGMVIDFGRLDRIVEEAIIARLDHQVINDLPEFNGLITTAEEVARWIFSVPRPAVAKEGAALTEVVLFEAPRYSARVTSDGGEFASD